MKHVKKILWLLLLIFTGYYAHAQANRGEVGVYKNKFIWTGTGEAFVPNYIMLDVLDSDLSKINDKNLQAFIDEFLHDHGFNGVHIPVYGQWFHIGNKKVTQSDSIPDQVTFDILKMIIDKVYQADGCVHLWAWGDDSRSQTAKSTADGIMGKQEKRKI